MNARRTNHFFPICLSRFELRALEMKTLNVDLQFNCCRCFYFSLLAQTLTGAQQSQAAMFPIQKPQVIHPCTIKSALPTLKNNWQKDCEITPFKFTVS